MQEVFILRANESDMKHILTTGLIAVVAFSSCNKDRNDHEVLTGRSWKMQQQYMNGNDITHPCRQDDVYKFNDDGSFTLTNGPETCGAGEATTLNGSWQLNPYGDRLNLVYPGNNITFEVITISKDRMDLRYLTDTNTIREVYIPN